MEINSNNRLLKAANLFNDEESTDTPTNPDLEQLMNRHEKLRSKQLRVLWDATTLKSYVTKSMIPRGLRIKKVPTAKYTEEFTSNGMLFYRIAHST